MSFEVCLTSILIFDENKPCRRNAIFANLPFQIVASILMIVPLYIYHGYETTGVDLTRVKEVKKRQDAAIALFYTSRLLSGFAAGT